MVEIHNEWGMVEKVALTERKRSKQKRSVERKMNTQREQKLWFVEVKSLNKSVALF